jgi:hypothetical protein
VFDQPVPFESQAGLAESRFPGGSGADTGRVGEEAVLLLLPGIVLVVLANMGCQRR